jgi:hexosaminidase
MKKLLLSFSVVLAMVSCLNYEPVNIIPKPSELEVRYGCFCIDETSRIVVKDDELMKMAQNFSSELEPLLGLSLPVEADSQLRSNIVLELSDKLEAEEYAIEVGINDIMIAGGTPAAVFYALQTLRQLIEDDGDVQAVAIKDKPYFAYRGVLLDVSRHFFTVEEVKKYIDILAMHKINRFHWHLTDDQGWRIEIRKHPRLTEVGSVRKQTLVGKHEASNNNGEYYIA